MHPRDFAHAPERVLKTPSVWLDPYLTLAVHDQHLLFPSMYKLQLHGWELRRLLDHKLVSEQEAEDNWLSVDRERLKDFDESGRTDNYVISRKRKRPTPGLRKQIRERLFPKMLPSEDTIKYAPVTEDMWGGDESITEWLNEVDEERGVVALIGGDPLFHIIHPEGRPGPTATERAKMAKEVDELIRKNIPNAHIPSHMKAVIPPKPSEAVDEADERQNRSRNHSI